MFTGRPEDLRRIEAEAASLAAEVTALLDRIDALGAGRTSGRIDGPGFQIRHDGYGWTCAG
ncbi:hypothetical protein OHV05_10160 [Kitasatospora sp. NBC_00070]|uniref:hypothetical protein n=1 Tax=Kitasatospora sp. NBC_00070 TaxID=2975962 RepID=UPI003246C308